MKYRYFSETLGISIQESGYDVDQVAAALGYKSSTFVLMWLSGEYGPRLDQISKLAGVLGVDVSFLLADWIADIHPEFRPQMCSMLASQGLAMPTYCGGATA